MICLIIIDVLFAGNIVSAQKRMISLFCSMIIVWIFKGSPVLKQNGLFSLTVRPILPSFMDRYLINDR
jgi:hypothetical protein